MSRIDALARVTQNLAIIRYQLEDLGRQGLYRPRFTEELVQRTLNTVTNQDVVNLNTELNNFPGIDLRSADETVGYQVTRHATKQKYDLTKRSLITELSKADSRLDGLRDVLVVGLTCVDNKEIRRWSPVDPSHTPRIRTIGLFALIDLSRVGDEELMRVDDVVQGFVHNWGRPLHSDAAEIRTIVGWLDRPAVRDNRSVEADWTEMNEAMKGIRRLLAQGVDDLGHPVTRPRSTFKAPFDEHLTTIYQASHRISRILAPSIRTSRTPESADVDLIDDQRRLIQVAVTTLCGFAEIDPPIW